MTCPERTLVDIAGMFHRDALEVAVDDAVLGGLTTVAVVRRYVSDRHLGSRRGAGTLAAILSDRTSGVPQKELERRFLRLVRIHRLPKPVRQHPEGSRYIDFAYPRYMIAIEVDGFVSRGTPRALRRDVNRQNEIVLAGWKILRFTWDDVTKNSEFVAETICTALRRAGSLS